MVKDIAIGISIGGAVGGAMLCVGSVFAGVGALTTGTLLASATLGGMSVLKGFAIGALAFDSFAYVTAPLLGEEVQGIEYEPLEPVLPVSPQPTVPHPAY